MQSVLANVLEAGYALYAVSYDSADILAGFAAKYGISYPLLSDTDSSVIKKLGILNEDALPAVAGIPHPGIFVLDADGTVRSKHFYESYRERDTAVGVLTHILGLPATPMDRVVRPGGHGVVVSASLDRENYIWGQRLWLRVEFEIPDGVHIYGRPVPEGYFPAEVTLAPIERVRFGAPEWPEPTSFRVTGLDEEFWVYSGSLVLELPITFLSVDAGTLTVSATVSYQACSMDECFLPQSTTIEFSVEERPLIERPQRPS